MPYKDKEKRRAYMKKWWHEHSDEMRVKRNQTSRRTPKKVKVKIEVREENIDLIKKQRSRDFLRKFLEGKKLKQ